MPPKKRKVEVETKDGDESGPPEEGDIEVKTERLSQDGVKDSPQKVEEKPGALRNLRPRKSTCYAEKDSPETNYEERQKKATRRKRRPAFSEDGSEGKESKIKRTEGSDEAVAATASSKETASLESEKTELPLPTLVSCSVLNSENPAFVKPSENNDDTTSGSAEAEVKNQPKKPSERKRPKKKLKAKPTESGIVPLDPDVVPKAEPLSPASNTENRQKTAEDPMESESVDTKATVPVKPKPKKRIRNKKLAVVSTPRNADGNPKEQPVIKQETEKTGEETTNDGKVAEGNEGEETAKPVIPEAPKKKLVKKKPKPKVKKEPIESDPEKTGGKSSKSHDGDGGSSKAEKEIKIEVEDGKTQGESGNAKAGTVVKKRVKSRPKKQAACTQTIACSAECNQEEIKPNGKEFGEKKKSSDGDNDDADEEPVARAPMIRKPFFRGRRPKSISARSGRKEIILGF